MLRASICGLALALLLALPTAPPASGQHASTEMRIRTLLDDAKARFEAGDYRRALKIAATARRLNERLSPPDAPLELRTLDTLAVLLRVNGRHAEAEPLQREAVARSRSILGEAHPDRLGYLNNLAALLFVTARYGEAIPVLREALASARATLGPAHPTTLTIVSNLTVALNESGFFVEAVDLAQESLGVSSEALGPNHQITLGIMNNTAQILSKHGRGEAAERLYRQVVESRRAVLGDTHPETLQAIDNLAVQVRANRSSAKDEALLREALDGRRGALGDRHPETLTSMSNLAALLDDQGQHAEAERLFRDVLDVRLEVLGVQHPATILGAANLASFLVRADRSGEAATLLLDLGDGPLAWVEGEIQRIEGASQRRRLAGDPSNFQNFALSVALVDDSVDARRLAGRTALAWKRIDGASEAILARFAADSRDPEVQRLARQIAGLRAELAAALNGDDPETSKRVDALNAARAALAERSSAFAALERERRAGLSEVRASLPSGAVLIEFRALQLLDFETDQFSPTRLVAVLIRPDAEPELRDLGPAREIEAQVDAMSNFEDAAARRAAARALSERLLSPFADALAEADRVYLAPDGPVSLLPFDLLPFADAAHWIEAQDVRLVSTGRVLVRERPARPASTGLVALGGADYERSGAVRIPVAGLQTFAAAARAATRASGLQPFKPLLLTGPEAGAVATLWASGTGEEARALAGAEARERPLKTLPAPPRVLHLATHGFYAPSAERAQVNPMALAGLALTGANRGLRGETDVDGEDGVLWALEAMSLPLRGTQLVALSACDTALGVRDAGEGVYGLGRGFEIAGADNVLLTLWALYDDRAARFMVDFYAAWTADGAGDPAEALRATKLAWLNADDPVRRDPESWAAYRLVQNGR